MNPSTMPSQDPALESFRDDILESGHEEVLDNRERGCGHLQHNAAYVRSDVAHFASPDGTIPRFVVLDEPVEYREHGERGAIIPGWRPFPGIEFGMAYVNEGGTTTTPEGAIPEQHDRMARTLRFDGEHFGAITAARSHDLLMSVGEIHWPTPEAYIEECRELGLNLKIPSGPGNEPPVINPLQTRCWIVHPAAITTESDTRAGIIGYAVLTRAIYTAGSEATADDPDIPAYAERWADAGRVSLVTPGEEIEADGLHPDQAGVSEWLDTAEAEADEAEMDELIDDLEGEAEDVVEEWEPEEPEVEMPGEEEPEPEPEEEGPTMTLIRREGLADHLEPFEHTTTLCGRSFEDAETERLRVPADPAVLAADPDYDVCGTCLTAFKNDRGGE